MGFLDTLRGWSTSQQEALKQGAAPAPRPPLDPSLAPTEISDFDREQWRKKLKRLLSTLPGTAASWTDLRQEAGALSFDERWLEKTIRQEFTLLVRKIVADRVVTAEEHEKLEQARSLLGIDDKEAEAIFHTIVAEAESFFGKTVEGA